LWAHLVKVVRPVGRSSLDKVGPQREPGTGEGAAAVRGWPSRARRSTC